MTTAANGNSGMPSIKRGSLKITDDLYAVMLDQISRLNVADSIKQTIRFKYLDDVVRLQSRANSFYRWFAFLKFTGIILGAAAPVLAGIGVSKTSTSPSGSDQFISAIRWCNFFVSLAAAACGGWLGFAKYGHRWKNAQISSDQLLNLLEDYLIKRGKFAKLATDEECYDLFKDKADAILRDDRMSTISHLIDKPHDTDAVQGAGRG